MNMKQIYKNGDIVTMNPEMPEATAFGILGDRFSSVGADDEVEKWADGGTKIVDLGGKTVIPGFNETHNHLSMYAMTLLHADCRTPPNQSIEDIKTRIREMAVSAKPDEWIRGWGYDDTLISEKRHLTWKDLDEVAPHNPVYISHVSGHLAYINSMALQIAGIGPDTPQPDGGEIDKDENGVPTGLLKELAQMALTSHIPPPDVGQYKEILAQAIAHFHQHGITSIHDGGVGIRGTGQAIMQALRELETTGELRLRMYLTVIEEFYRGILKLGLGTGFGSEYLKLGCVKLLQDGSIQGLTGALTEPYHNKPDHRGDLIMPQETLDKQVEKYHSAGLQIAIHANGDRAIESCLLAIEKAQVLHPRRDHRHMIIHCQTATPDHIVRMKRLGVVPSYFVNHVYYWGDRHVSLFLGPERAARISPLASSLKEGLIFTLHSDLPVTPVDPIFSIHTAVNRITREGKVLGPDERISPLEALKTYSTHAAYCSFEENIKGSIEVGKLADFAVLSDNPLTVDTDKIKDIQALQTVVGGQSVYER
jgi:predicted amidohydrolase YtcJ